MEVKSRFGDFLYLMLLGDDLHFITEKALASLCKYIFLFFYLWGCQLNPEAEVADHRHSGD